ncbi:MAG: DUF2939 domain-containing protein [Lautropia sp.]
MATTVLDRVPAASAAPGRAAPGPAAPAIWPVRLFCAAVVVALAMPLWLAAGPWVALYRIKSAVDRHDAAALAELVAFAELRTRVRARHAPPPDAAAGFFAGLATTVKARLVDVAVDRLVTPAMLARVLYGRRVWQALRAEPVDAGAPPSLADALARTRFGYQGRTRFSLWVRDDDGAEACLVLVLDGASWKIGDVVLAR